MKKINIITIKYKLWAYFINDIFWLIRIWHDFECRTSVAFFEQIWQKVDMPCNARLNLRVEDLLFNSSSLAILVIRRSASWMKRPYAVSPRLQNESTVVNVLVSWVIAFQIPILVTGTRIFSFSFTMTFLRKEGGLHSCSMWLFAPNLFRRLVSWLPKR